ncbi:DUF6069 family protein [Nonomuraea sp. NPDC049152]|uniref:DUF6069 family protein n=1 Tax=Nonomuraea sp. NPDC049152 TaxID=3154350 RepID=UPI0033EF9D3C
MASQTENALPTGTRRRHRAIGVAATVAAAAAVWVVGEPLLGYDLVVKQPGQAPMDLGLDAIAVVTLVASLLGWALLAGLERLTDRAAAIWTALALLVLALSFLPLFGVESSGGSKAILALLHVAVGAVLIPAFWRTRRTGRAERPVPAAS